MSGDMRFGQALRVATIVVALGTFLSSCGEEKTEQQASNTAATSPATNQQATTDPAASTAATPPAQEASAAPAQGDAVKELNVYNWSDYIGETTIADFEKETGIKVRYETYTGNEDLEAKLVTGGTGYDIVFPSSSFFARQIKIGLYQKLDKSLLPNLKNMDPKIMDILSKDADPGNEYAIPYMWGTNGFSYNVDMVKERMPDAPLDSLAMIFDPNVIAKFKDCGVTFLDSPEDVFPLALAYMGKDPTSQKEEDIIAAADMVMKVRPFIRNFDSQQYLNALPNGEYCISMSWSGDYATASTRAAEAGMKVNLAYTIPKEGTNIWFDGMLIPADAPHPKNANLFLNYMMRPEVIAAATNFTYYANANLPAKEFVNKEILDDPAIYPSEEVLKRGFPSVVRDQNLNRIITREWTRVKTGQ
jgi:putrescine transport system substrate-binding protein